MIQARVQGVAQSLTCRSCGEVMPVTVSPNGERLIIRGGAEIRHKVTLHCKCGAKREFVPVSRRQVRGS